MLWNHGSFCGYAAALSYASSCRLLNSARCCSTPLEVILGPGQEPTGDSLVVERETFIVLVPGQLQPRTRIGGYRVDPNPKYRL